MHRLTVITSTVYPQVNCHNIYCLGISRSWQTVWKKRPEAEQYKTTSIVLPSGKLNYQIIIIWEDVTTTVVVVYIVQHFHSAKSMTNTVNIVIPVWFHLVTLFLYSPSVDALSLALKIRTKLEPGRMTFSQWNLVVGNPVQCSPV